LGRELNSRLQVSLEPGRRPRFRVSPGDPRRLVQEGPDSGLHRGPVHTHLVEKNGDNAILLGDQGEEKVLRCEGGTARGVGYLLGLSDGFLGLGREFIKSNQWVSPQSLN